MPRILRLDSECPALTTWLIALSGLQAGGAASRGTRKQFVRWRHPDCLNVQWPGEYQRRRALMVHWRGGSVGRANSISSPRLLDESGGAEHEKFVYGTKPLPYSVADLEAAVFARAEALAT